jgi:PST family polysaccharide transporter
VNYFSRNLDNLLIGKFLGSAALGYYDKSYKLMLYPVQNLTHVITPVLHPILSVHQEDSDFIYQKYIGVVKILSLLGVFITAFSFYASEEIILILYGSQWKDSITSFRFLSLSIWAQMITSSTGSIFQSLGKTKYLFITGTISAVIIVSSIIIGILFKDLNTVALCVAIAYNINMFTSFFILIRKGFRKSFNFFAKNFVPDLLILLSQMLGMYLLSSVFRQPLLINVVLKLIICSTLYVVSLLIFRQLKYLKKYLK